MSPHPEPSAPVVVVVAGVAGSGKSTLGRALAASLRLPLLDLDSLTNPLLEALPDEVWGGHWMSSPLGTELRTGRYAALRAVARDVVATGPGCVLVAPFTAELRGGDEWDALREAVGSPLHVVHVSGDPELLASRRSGRAEARDAHRPDDPGPSSAPVVPVIAVDADLRTDQQLLRVVQALGHREPVDPTNVLLGTSFDAVLFDLDGTLADSTASVIRSWRRFAREFGVPMDRLHANHGQPAQGLIAALLPAERAAEGLARIQEIEVADATSVTPITGAAALFGAVPPARRAIVTSGTVPIATARLAAVGLEVPDVMVTAEQVRRGKPDPEPFLLAAEQLGVDPARCLVLEDAPAGVQAAKRAGCRVLALTGTVGRDALQEADLVVDHLGQLELSTGDEDGRDVVRLRVRPTQP